MKAIKRSYNKNLSYLPLTGGTLTGNLRVAHWVTIDTGYDGWQAYEFVNGDGKSRGGMQMGADNSLVLYQQHANSQNAEKYALPWVDSNLSGEMWYRLYSSKNISAGSSDITAGSSYLADTYIHLVYS